MRSCNAIQPLKQISIHCNTFTPMTNEERVWKMADGYCEVYYYRSNFDFIFRHC